MNLCIETFERGGDTGRRACLELREGGKSDFDVDIVTNVGKEGGVLFVEWRGGGGGYIYRRLGGVMTRDVTCVSRDRAVDA